MKNITKFLLLSLYCLLMISVPTVAQDKNKPGAYSQPVAFGPIDTSKGIAKAQAMAEYLIATDSTSETRVDVTWGIVQGCFWGGPLSIKLYRDNVEIFSYDYAWTAWLAGWTHGYSENVGPGKSYTYKLVTHYTGWTCDYYTTWTDAGSTAQFKRPENFFASLDTTVGYVRLGWTCASEYATHFQIYRDDLLLTTIPFSQKSYLDYSAVPTQTHTYKVRSYNNISGLSSIFSDSKSGRVVYLNASDGTYAGKVYINWTDFPAGFEDDLRLYRDGVRLAGVYSNQVDKYDEGVTPGKIHKYKLEVLKNTQIILTITNHGFTPADGSVKGSVTTPTGSGGVKNVEMRAYATSDNLSNALSLDGIDDYASAPPLKLNSNTVTMSAWIKRYGAQNDWAGIIFSRARSTVAGLSILNSGELRYTWNAEASTYNWSSGLIVPDSQWTFIALVIKPDSATIYMNDTLAVNRIPHGNEEFDGNFEIGRDVASSSRSFKGLIDEICVWNTSRTSEEIIFDKQHIMRGNETSLIAYWRFNQSTDTVAGDYAIDGDHHGVLFGNPAWVEDSPKVWHYGTTLTNGSYTIARINWEENVDFTIRPYKRGHGFKGSTFPQDSIVLPFTQDNHTHISINFLDTTAIEVSGWVYLKSNPLCPLPGAKILVNGSSAGEYTDSSGHYSISVAEAGNYTFSTEYLNHKFKPADTLRNIQDPVTDLIFLDTTKTTLSGKVAGGCDNYLGVAYINIKSLVSNCIDTTLRTDTLGTYLVRLPAQPYIVQLAHIDHSDSITIINYFTRDTIDITEHDTTHHFIYHSPPITEISELPPVGCGDYNVPLLLQERTYAMKVDVTEKYGNLECQVDSGKVTLYDNIAYSNRDTTIILENGSTYYPLIPGYPNIAGGGAHPYQKMLVVKTEVDKYTLYDTLWVFVRGQKPREFQFTTVSPEIPLMILRDPPGDQSYSYISTTTSSSVSIGFSFETEVGVGVFAKFKVGGGGDIPGVGSTGAWVGGEAEAKVGLRNTLEGTQEIKISTTEILRTSDDDVITGAEGDVYMGAALNLMYAKTDIVDYDSSSCSVALDTGIVWNGNGFKTTYLYTESYIRESVLPSIRSLAAILSSSSDPLKQDSAEVLLNQDTVWQQVLNYNAALKNNAIPIPEFPSNVSFAAGTNLSEEATITSTSTLSIGLNLFIDAEVALSIGAKVGEFNEAEAGVKIFAKLDVGISGSTTYEVTNTIGFELADDDAAPPGDGFTVDILGDPVYGTPVFKLLSGVSSCPWEHPTLPREGVGLSMNTYVLNDVPPNVPAQFNLYLYNMSQNDETRSYLLSLVQGSNPDGAIISVGGAVLGDDQLLFSMPPNRTNPQQATLRVAREVGSVYDYENLMVHLYSACDDQFDTTVSFSVHFAKPCSDVRIVKPSMNWIVNANNNNQMVIVLKDYDTAYQNMQQLKFKYRMRGTNNWIQLFNYPRASLPPDSILYLWDMSALPEGGYELRALTQCTADSFFTRTYAGVLDHTPPAVSGDPQPSDGMLNAGDNIKIEFTEDINCATANKQNMKMHNISKDLDVNINILCIGDTVGISPVNYSDMIEGDTMRVTIDSLSDNYGNILTEPITWEFVIDLVTSVDMFNSWNLISVPLIVSDSRKSVLFPTSISSAFAYLPPPTGYVAKETLKTGVGYWLKFPSAQAVLMEGLAVDPDTVSISSGWNMIGTISYPALTADVMPIGPLVIRSSFFGFEGVLGYQPEDTLKPGRGYWVKVNQSGNIVIRSSSIVPLMSTNSALSKLKKSHKNTLSEIASTEGLSKIEWKDNAGRERLLLFSSTQKKIALDEFELPPQPPPGIFDVRFKSQRSVETVTLNTSDEVQELPITIAGAEFPLSVSWDVLKEDEQAVLELLSAGGELKKVPLKKTGEVVIDRDNILAVTLRLIPTKSGETPKEFALHQNYPNPFNPATVIRYQIPDYSWVTLKIYNVLGQEVKTLVDEMEEAGFKTVKLDATNLPSGVYSYRLRAGDYQAVKKMVLIK